MQHDDQFHEYHLETGKTKCIVQGFNGQQLNGCRRGKSCPNRNESSPQGKGSIRLDGFHGAIHKPIVYFFVERLIHQRGTDAVKGGHGDRHGLVVYCWLTQGCGRSE